jgi:hypothetical protein
MLTCDIRSKVDALWNAFLSGGIANPIEVIEQITYLLFLKRLDDLGTLEESKSARRPLGEILENLRELDAEIQQGMKGLEGMLK